MSVFSLVFRPFLTLHVLALSVHSFASSFIVQGKDDDYYRLERNQKPFGWQIYNPQGDALFSRLKLKTLVKKGRGFELTGENGEKILLRTFFHVRSDSATQLKPRKPHKSCPQLAKMRNCSYFSGKTTHSNQCK